MALLVLDSEICKQHFHIIEQDPYGRPSQIDYLFHDLAAYRPQIDPTLNRGYEQRGLPVIFGTPNKNTNLYAEYEAEGWQTVDNYLNRR